MTNKQRGEVEIPLGDSIYTMVLNFESMVEIEEKTGLGIFKLFEKACDGTFTLTEMTIIIHTCIVVGDDKDKPSYIEIGAMILADGVSNLITPVGIFFTMAVNSGQKKSKATKKTRKK